MNRATLNYCIKDVNGAAASGFLGNYYANLNLPSGVRTAKLKKTTGYIQATDAVGIKIQEDLIDCFLRVTSETIPRIDAGVSDTDTRLPIRHGFQQSYDLPIKKDQTFDFYYYNGTSGVISIAVMIILEIEITF